MTIRKLHLPALLIVVLTALLLECVDLPAPWAAQTEKEAYYRGQPTRFWLAQLQDHDPAFRQQAIQALEQIGYKHQDVVPALAGMLKDPDKGVRIGAVFALRRLGADAKMAVPSLMQALADADHFVRLNAAWALASIRPEDERVIAALVPLLQDESALVRQAIRQILGDTDDPDPPTGGPVIPRAGACCPNQRMRGGTFLAVARIGVRQRQLGNVSTLRGVRVIVPQAPGSG